MANWISSKLKAAETLLQQALLSLSLSNLMFIDQQAADSLRKNERPYADELNVDTPTKSEGIVPLKDQLKKKPQENNDYNGKLRSDPNFSTLNSKETEISSAPKPSPKPKSSTLMDSDWTELLGTPNQSTSSVVNRSNGGSVIRGLRKDGKRRGSSGANVLVSEVKRNQKSSGNGSSVLKSGWKSREESKFKGKAGDGEESSSSDSLGRSSSVDVQSDGKYLEGREIDRNETGVKLVGESKNERNEENGRHFESKGVSSEDSSPLNQTVEMKSVLEKVDVVSDVKMRMDNVQGRLRNTIKEKQKSVASSRSSVSDDLKRGSSSTIDLSSDSDSDSGSTSDSESENERREKKKRREKILAEKLAARAVEAIKERENVVARLEGEKQSLEKILEDRAKQQAQEASDLQTTMMETLDAVDLEKQKHNNTRREALERLAKLEASDLQTTMMETLDAVDLEKQKHNNTRREALERLAKLELMRLFVVTKGQKFLQTANADLARSLATVQWNLEVQVNWVAEIREQIELKEATCEEIKRRISNSHQTGTSLKQLAASKGMEFEREILEAEYSLIADKVIQLQDKAKKLEANIEITKKEMEEPTEVETELKQRLGQMTDHLIQKQAQVEALSSEKATLLFRIEAVSRFLDENKTMLADSVSTSSRDLESGRWELSESNWGPLFHDRMRSGRKHLGSLLQQLDAIFLAGQVFLRRNSRAKVWSLVYLVCLHFWVIYIFMSHSRESNGVKSGAVISLENINNTAGV
ncbi:golgin candidate 2 [Quercus suber]|uniref:Golgin candidate 2 n=1 Tax=Quercus suber TaxID=58331 RepID=A0AAW0KXZ6_QUESU